MHQFDGMIYVVGYCQRTTTCLRCLFYSLGLRSVDFALLRGVLQTGVSQSTVSCDVINVIDCQQHVNRSSSNCQHSQCNIHWGQTWCWLSHSPPQLTRHCTLAIHLTLLIFCNVINPQYPRAFLSVSYLQFHGITYPLVLVPFVSLLREFGTP